MTLIHRTLRFVTILDLICIAEVWNRIYATWVCYLLTGSVQYYSLTGSKNYCKLGIKVTIVTETVVCGMPPITDLWEFLAKLSTLTLVFQKVYHFAISTNLRTSGPSVSISLRGTLCSVALYFYVNVWSAYSRGTLCSDRECTDPSCGQPGRAAGRSPPPAPRSGSPSRGPARTSPIADTRRSRCLTRLYEIEDLYCLYRTILYIHAELAYNVPCFPGSSQLEPGLGSKFGI